MLGITRRRLLAGGAVGAVLSALGTGSAALLLRPAPGAHSLSSEELAIVEAIALTLFPGGPFPVDGREAGVAPEVDRILGEMLHPIHARGFRALLLGLEGGTLASRGSRFTALPPAQRAEVLETWSDPRLFERRLAGDAFRLVLGMAYFQNPVVLAHIGWAPGCDDWRPAGTFGEGA